MFSIRLAIFLVFLFSIITVSAQTTSEIPREWIDKDTGHRIVRLSDDDGSSSFYFHQNGYTASGDKFVFSTRTGLSTYNFKTKKIEQIVEGRAGSVVVGKKSRKVFYTKGETVYETDIDTKATREIVKDARFRTGSGFAVNADETLLGGSMEINPKPREPQTNQPNQPRGDNYVGKGEMMENRLAAKIPMTLYTINIKSGAVKTFHEATDWLNHVQFSPTDPGLMMFCHEGPWHKVDRIWTIKTDGTSLTKVHTRTMEIEIA